mmetsp:Transcript_1227/g.2602  ORF Transcript_1227/g.2602 Transcript_1227/m.2602 type:complete len:264 (+) Transcript_1227:655-1446(+)
MTCSRVPNWRWAAEVSTRASTTQTLRGTPTGKGTSTRNHRLAPSLPCILGKGATLRSRPLRGAFAPFWGRCVQSTQAGWSGLERQGVYPMSLPHCSRMAVHSAIWRCKCIMALRSLPLMHASTWMGSTRVSTLRSPYVASARFSASSQIHPVRGRAIAPLTSLPAMSTSRARGPSPMVSHTLNAIGNHASSRCNAGSSSHARRRSSSNRGLTSPDAFCPRSRRPSQVARSECQAWPRWRRRPHDDRWVRLHRGMGSGWGSARQ